LSARIGHALRLASLTLLRLCVEFSSTDASPSRVNVLIATTRSSQCPINAVTGSWPTTREAVLDSGSIPDGEAGVDQFPITRLTKHGHGYPGVANYPLVNPGGSFIDAISAKVYNQRVRFRALPAQNGW